MNRPSRIPFVTVLLFAVAASPAPARAQFPDHVFQAEASVGGLLPGYGSVFASTQAGGGRRVIKRRTSPAIGGRFLVLWPRGLYSGIAFALVPDIPLENKRLGTHVGVAERVRLSVALGGQTRKIPGTPVRFRGGFDVGFARYTFVEDPGESFPRAAGTNLLAGLTMGWDVELARPISLITDLLLSFEDGQTESMSGLLVHLGLAVRFPDRGR